MPIRLLQDMECSGKTVVIRQDLNVPMKDGRITNDKRIRAALPGIRMALDKGAGVVLLSHLGRPTEGVVEEKFSLAPVAAHLSGLLGRPVKLAADFDAAKAAPGEVVLLENIPEPAARPKRENESLLNGPQLDTSKAGVVASQDQVDDLLDSLGF